ncbi:hypothetical protein Ahia01_001241700 [Argonauta hians]
MCLRIGKEEGLKPIIVGRRLRWKRNRNDRNAITRMSEDIISCETIRHGNNHVDNYIDNDEGVDDYGLEKDEHDYDDDVDAGNGQNDYDNNDNYDFNKNVDDGVDAGDEEEDDDDDDDDEDDNGDDNDDDVSHATMKTPPSLSHFYHKDKYPRKQNENSTDNNNKLKQTI